MSSYIGVQRRMSNKFSNLDPNTYRAFKQMVPNITNSKTRPTSPKQVTEKQNFCSKAIKSRNSSKLELLKPTNNISKFPFALTEKRFKWQTNRFINENPEANIQGKNKLYRHKNRSGNWEGVVNLSVECFPDQVNRDALKKYISF
jgi:hypothetical protein